MPTTPDDLASLVTRIYINRFQISHNRNPGVVRKPCVVVRQGSERLDCWGVEIQGPSRLVYDPNNPIQDGTTAWVETESPVVPQLKP